MKRILIIFFLAINSAFIFAQINLTIEGTVTNSSETGSWDGVNIQRTSPTNFIFRNNSLTSVNTSGYMLQAGDEGIGSTNNNLDGEVITGNKFIWNGSDMASITHGVFTGHNRNAVIEYNYLNKVPMGIIRKSASNMTNTGGAVAYNIIVSPATGIVIKGMSNVNIYNNTFYQARTTAETGRGLIDIYTNTDVSPTSMAHGTKIKNNIFYSKYQTTNIRILDNDCLVGLECDYNLYWCESGTPKFEVNGSLITYAQWQAMGYDAHSVVVNPNFNNFTDFLPAARLNYGTNLTSAWQTGLSTTAGWTLNVAPATANQDANWQVGARIYESAVVTAAPLYLNSTVENAAPSVVVLNFNLSLSSSTPAVSAFKVSVNSVVRTVNSVTVSGTKVSLTLASPIKYGDVITVTYTKPATNPIQTASGGIAQNIPVSTTTNNLIAPVKDETVSLKMTISPNHVHKTVNLLLEYVGTIAAVTTAFTPEIVRISDIEGKLLVEKMLATGVTSAKIPVNLKSGIYIVEIYGNALLRTSQKMIIY
jgi:uncharacterized repeat protein (TIGR02059 family)